MAVLAGGPSVTIGQHSAIDVGPVFSNTGPSDNLVRCDGGGRPIPGDCSGCGVATATFTFPHRATEPNPSLSFSVHHNFLCSHSQHQLYMVIGWGLAVGQISRWKLVVWLVVQSAGWRQSAGSGHPFNGIPRNEYDDSLSPPINQIDIAHSAGISAGPVGRLTIGRG